MLLLTAFFVLFTTSTGYADSYITNDQLTLPDSWKDELQLADELGITLRDTDQENVSGAEMMKLLDRLVAKAAPDRLDEWRAMYPQLRNNPGLLTRFDAMGMLFLTADFIGGNYSIPVEGSVPTVLGILHFPWDAYYFTEGLFEGIDGPKFSVPGFGDGNYLDFAALNYNLWRSSPVSDEYPFAYDAENNSIHEDAAPSYLEAVLAVIRTYLIGNYRDQVSHDDPAARTPGNAISRALAAKAGEKEAVTAENHPFWSGFILGYGTEYQFGTSSDEIRLVADWGFNSVRLNLSYLTLFGTDVQNVKLSALKQLDELITTAIENDLHFNLCLTGVPGHSVMNQVTDFQYSGDFDLFVNPEKQDKALAIYETLAARYKEIPNDYLSFTPIWEAMNRNLSTGLPAPEYSEQDVASFLIKAIDVIREESPDRLIIYEPTPGNDADQIIRESKPIKEAADNKGNVMINYNFAQYAYVYACLTATEGKHIDTMNHSMFIPEYPTVIYSVAANIHDDMPLILDGFLPAGTTIDFYLARSFGAVLDISVDGLSVYREELPQNTEYTVGEKLSFLYPFAVSDKNISITLEKDTKEVKIGNMQNGGFDLSGICLTLPEEYAVERWYYAQTYDVYNGTEETEGVIKRSSSQVLISPNDYDEGGRNVTIQEDLSYSTELIREEASRETIETWCDKIAAFDSNCVIRFERADFSGARWDAMAAYYNDLLSAFKEHSFSWWTNDWWLMTDEYAQTHNVAESPGVEYAGYPRFNLELLHLLQRYQ